MNTPLFSALGTAQLLEKEFDSETENYKDVQTILTNLQEMRRLIQKISIIDRIEMKDYVGNSRIIDFEKSSKENEFFSPNHAEH